MMELSNKSVVLRTVLMHAAERVTIPPFTANTTNAHLCSLRKFFMSGLEF